MTVKYGSFIFCNKKTLLAMDPDSDISEKALSEEGEALLKPCGGGGLSEEGEAPSEKGEALLKPCGGGGGGGLSEEGEAPPEEEQEMKIQGSRSIYSYRWKGRIDDNIRGFNEMLFLLAQCFGYLEDKPVGENVDIFMRLCFLNIFLVRLPEYSSLFTGLKEYEKNCKKNGAISAEDRDEVFQLHGILRKRQPKDDTRHSQKELLELFDKGCITSLTEKFDKLCKKLKRIGKKKTEIEVWDQRCWNGALNIEVSKISKESFVAEVTEYLRLGQLPTP